MNNNSTSNANIKQAVPFFMITDMSNSLNFYIKGLGFELKNKWEPLGTIEWCWLQIENAALMLQEYRDNIPTEKLGQGVSICFMCEDALKIYEKVKARGIKPDEPFIGNNLWVVQLKDPDGYSIALKVQLT